MQSIHRRSQHPADYLLAANWHASGRYHATDIGGWSERRAMPLGRRQIDGSTTIGIKYLAMIPVQFESSFAHPSHDDLQSPGKGRLFSGHKVAFGLGSIQATCHTSRFREILIARHIGKLTNRD